MPLSSNRLPTKLESCLRRSVSLTRSELEKSLGGVGSTGWSFTDTELFCSLYSSADFLRLAAIYMRFLYRFILDTCYSVSVACVFCFSVLRLAESCNWVSDDCFAASAICSRTMLLMRFGILVPLLMYCRLRYYCCSSSDFSFYEGNFAFYPFLLVAY